LDKLGARNAAVCRAFIGYLLASGLSYARASAYIDTFMTFGRYVKKNFEDVSKEDVERFFESIFQARIEERSITTWPNITINSIKRLRALNHLKSSGS